MTTLKLKGNVPSTLNLRNVGISAHIDSGKTTLTERMLFYGGRIHKIREVRGGDGGATMDFDPIEKKRGITIASAVTRIDWNDHAINVIDTPGHVDFTVEVERSLRVLDGAVLVLCASRGVQSQSLTVDRQMKRYGVPRIAFINKMDRIGANPENVIAMMRSRLNDNAVAIQIAIGREESFEGVVDLVAMEAIYFDGDHGETVRRESVPQSLTEQADKARGQMLEALAFLDDRIMEKMIDGQEPEESLIHSVIRTQTLNLKLTPVLVGSAYKNKGVQGVLDAINAYLPSPTESEEKAHDRNGNEVELRPDPESPVVAMAFKTVVEKFGQLTFLRVFQGTLRKGATLVSMTTGKPIRFGRLVRVHAAQRQDVDVVPPGEIVGAIGIDCRSGDTFVTRGLDVRLETFSVAEPVMHLAIAPVNREDVDKLAMALARFTRDDPTLRTSTDPDTGETLISGMGQLHLQVYVERLKQDHDCPCIVGAPRVALQARPTRSVDFAHQFDKQTGGPGQFAQIVGTMEPRDDEDFCFEETIVGGRIEKRFIPAVRKGFMEGLVNGPLGGYPVLGVSMTLIDGKQHEKDSSEVAFQNCAAQVVREVILPQAGLRLWEPVMKVDIEVPEPFVGTVSGYVSRKRGIVTGTNMIEATAVVSAEVPLAELFDCSNEIRSMTQGQGTLVMTPIGFRKMPKSVEEEVL